jgi:uncharacterized protein YqhQ
MDNKRTLPNYGGQAVMEGVMMRGRRAMAIAVRKPDGGIRISVRPLSGIYASLIARIPFLRGAILLWDTFGIGMDSINISLESQGEEALSKRETGVSILLALLIAVGVFFVLPVWIATAVSSWVGWTELGSTLLEGFIRLLFLIGYMGGIGFIPEIKRVFAYHGAEHRTIHAFEAGVDLTPPTVEPFPNEHPRCGTSFLIVLVVVGILFFALLGPMPFWQKILIRIVSIPVLVGLGYEYLRISARIQNSILGKALALPGLWAQRLTTRTPDRSMLEVAIAAFQAMRQADEEDIVLPSDNTINASGEGTAHDEIR